MNDEQYFLANAYVDGELTGAERRSAESDPDVMSEVEQLLSLRSRIRSVEPPSAARREAAIAAAMAGFGVASSVPQRTTVSTVMEFRRRRWSTRYLGIAAGLVMIGLLGAVVVTSLNGSNDDDSASKFVADEPTAALAVEESASTRILESSDAAPVGGADAELAPAADQPEAAAEAPAQEPASAAEDEVASDSSGTIPAARPVIDPTQPLSTPAELGSYGTYLVELRQAGQLPPTPNTKCSQPGILGSTRYLFDDEPFEVLVAVDDTARTTTAIDPDTCRELVVGPLF